MMLRRLWRWVWPEPKIGATVNGEWVEGRPPPPPNPTQCTQYWVDGAWRVWCEVDLAGPCRGCPEGPA